MRIALANLRHPASPDESVALAEDAIAQASLERAGIIGFENTSSGEVWCDVGNSTFKRYDVP